MCYLAHGVIIRSNACRSGVLRTYNSFNAWGRLEGLANPVLAHVHVLFHVVTAAFDFLITFTATVHI